MGTKRKHIIRSKKAHVVLQLLAGTRVPSGVQYADQSPYPDRQGNRTRHRARLPGEEDQGARGGEGRDSAGAAAVDLRGEADEHDKTAAEYSLEGGATLHLVLALRGGQQ